MKTNITIAKKELNEAGYKMSKKAKAFITSAATIGASALMTINAYALNIDTNYAINDNVATTNPEGLIIGIAVWVCRLIGIGMLIWGIYGYITARKDGEADAMNGAIGKLVAGLILICMPAVLKGLSII